jgi:predicted DNA-binding protein YlxM (UPF0122 family)
MTKAKRRMTEADFDAARKLLKNVSDERAAAARSALVDGETLAVIAERHNCSRQAVNNVVGTFWDKLEEYHEAQRAKTHAGVLVPPGWEVVTLIAPSTLIEKFRSEIAALGSSGNGR